MRLFNSQRSPALFETALTLPPMRLVSVSNFGFGRAWLQYAGQTSAAREDADLAVRPTEGTSNVPPSACLQGAPCPHSAGVIVIPFIVLNPVASLVVGNSNLGGASFAMTASAEVRKEE
jgi:hypothetical protein